jgi:GTPase SAR1 family protein
MGLCPSKEDGEGKDDVRINTDKRLSVQLEKDKDKDDEVLKLLLLGPGESGKSTLLKQIIHLHGRGFDDLSRASYKSRIYQAVITSIKTLISQSSSLPPHLDCHWGSMSEDSVKYIHELKLDFSHLGEELARHIKKVWGDPGIKNTYAARSRFQLPDECKWFFDRIEELGKPGYVPSYQDILRARQKTTGIVETTFAIKNNVFRISDVGGQRNERKKWFHCFEHVITAVIFVAAINEYDQVLYEDGATNRLHETLELFGEICNSRWLAKSAMILFLNKSDLFKEKMKTVDMKCCFQDYDGGDDYDEAIDFLKQEFKMRNSNPRRPLYIHVTCATDTENVQFTFNAVKDVIVRSGLKECGLL